jgi:hypothetical protein
MKGRHRLRGWSRRVHRECGDLDLIEGGRSVCYSCRRYRWPVLRDDLERRYGWLTFERVRP